MDYRSFASKAEENIAAAECEYHHGRYNASANRAYYAMFHAAIAALLYRGINPPGPRWEHSWVQAAFSEQLIKRRKVYPLKLASDLLAVMSVRDVADYKDAMVSQKRAYRALRRAKQFLETVLVRLGGTGE